MDDDELLRFCRSTARDPDGGDGCCLARPGAEEPGAVPALRLDHIAVVVQDLERAVRLFELSERRAPGAEGGEPSS